MDFVDWCSIVLRAVDGLMQEEPFLRQIGVNERDLARAVFGVTGVEQWVTFRESKRPEGLWWAAHGLEQAGLLERPDKQSRWRTTRGANSRRGKIPAKPRC